MKVVTTSSSGKSFSKKSETVGQLRIPAVGLQMVAPISFDAKPEKASELNEKEILDEAKKETAKLMSKLADEVEIALTDALRASVWQWTGGNRDIYDTGELANSVTVTASSNGISVTYGVPYANIIHNGGYIAPYGNKNARPVYLPGRPWVSSVLYGGGPVPQFDFQAFMQRNMG